MSRQCRIIICWFLGLDDSLRFLLMVVKVLKHRYESTIKGTFCFGGSCLMTDVINGNCCKYANFLSWWAYGVQMFIALAFLVPKWTEITSTLSKCTVQVGRVLSTRSRLHVLLWSTPRYTGSGGSESLLCLIACSSLALFLEVSKSNNWQISRSDWFHFTSDCSVILDPCNTIATIVRRVAEIDFNWQPSENSSQNYIVEVIVSLHTILAACASTTASSSSTSVTMAFLSVAPPSLLHARRISLPLWRLVTLGN